MRELFFWDRSASSLLPRKKKTTRNVIRRQHQHRRETTIIIIDFDHRRTRWTRHDNNEDWNERIAGKTGTTTTRTKTTKRRHQDDDNGLYLWRQWVYPLGEGQMPLNLLKPRRGVQTTRPLEKRERFRFDGDEPRDAYRIVAGLQQTGSSDRRLKPVNRQNQILC